MSDPHKELKRQYQIDVLMYGENAAPKYWQVLGNGWDNYKNIGPLWVEGNKYRRDPAAPSQPSRDWVNAPDWAQFRYIPSGIWWKGRPIVSDRMDFEHRPPQAVIEKMREWEAEDKGCDKCDRPDTFASPCVCDEPARPMLTVDGLAQEIRRVDGNHSIGAGALAEALMPYIVAASGGQIDE